MKKRWICLLLVLLAVLVWVHIPVRVCGTVVLHSEETAGEELSAAFDLKLSRSLLAPPVIDGTIRIGGKEYVAWVGQNYSFLQNIHRKLSGEENIPVFACTDSMNQGTSEMLSDLLYLHRFELGAHNTITAVSLSMTADGRGMWEGSA